MRITHLSLVDFRNYQAAEVPFRPGPNLLIGRNGQGKTNLAEAIAYFSSLSSHRVTGDAALIRAGTDSAVMRMRVSANDREVLLESQLNRGRANRAQVNRNSVRPRELTRWFTCVLFAPEDLTLVRGEPGIRRRFLDDAVTARQPAFASTLGDYERVVKQRTALLKAARAGGSQSALDATLEVWDARLVELGVKIMLARRALVASLERPLIDAYASLVEHDHAPIIELSETVLSESLDVSRETNSDDRVSRETLSEQFRHALSQVRRQEIERAVTLVGPHRDDAEFSLNRLPVKGYASHGETWSFVLAVRLSLAILLREESVAGDPVVILDDVFAELDMRRRSALMTAVAQFEQVIVTAAVEDDVPTGPWHRIRVESGSVLASSDS
jgi:DNA replication and repair protein RecF